MAALELIYIYKEKQYEKLEESISKLSASTLKDLFSKWLLSNINEDGINLLKAIFFGRKSLTNEFDVCAAYKACFNILQNSTVDNAFHTEMICILNDEANNLSSNNLDELCSFMLNMIQKGEIGQGRLLVVFQKLLDTIQQCASAKYNKSKLTLTGIDYKQEIIKDLCSCIWPHGCAIHLVNMLKELRLSSTEANPIVGKLLKQLNTINPQEIPPFTFQLLGLASGCNKAQSVIWGIMRCFKILNSKVEATEDLDTGLIEEMAHSTCALSKSDLQSIEGTLLLYFGNAVRQNHSLGKGFLKIIKEVKQSLSPELITPFFLALGLVVAEDNRFHTETHNMLRLLIFRCFQDAHKIKDCKFLQDHAAQPPNINEILLVVAKSCQQGWDHIVNGLVDLCFSLMEHFGPKQGPFAKSLKKHIKKSDSPEDHACNVGSHVLSIIFRRNQEARHEILSQIFNRIQVHVNSPSYHYISLLKHIIKWYPQAVLQVINQLIYTFAVQLPLNRFLELLKVKFVLEDLAMIHPYNAEKLLLALMPLVTMSASLKNSLILVLRKSLSSRDVNSRLTALYGFLLMLKNFCLSESTSLSQVSSQSSQSIFSTASLHVDAEVHKSSGVGNNNEMLCTEILQALRRCLLQQASIKTELYIGLHEVIVKNVRLGNLIIEGMLTHLRLFYKEDGDIIPPLDTNKCVSGNNDNFVMQEPLPVLLASIANCLHHVTTNNIVDTDEVIDNCVIDSIRALLKSLTLRMCKCDLDDFQLDTTSIQSSSLQPSHRNPVVLGIVLSVFEVLMEYNYLHASILDESAELILSLFHSYKKVKDQIQGAKSTQNSDKAMLDILLCSTSMNYLSDLVYTLFCKDDVSTAEPLLSDENFLQHVVFLLHSMLTYAKDHGDFPGISAGSGKTQLVERAVHACLHRFLLEKNEPERSPVTLLCLECVHVGIQYYNAWQKKSLGTFITAISGDSANQNSTQENCVMRMMKQLQRVIITCLLKDVSPLSACEKKILNELITTVDTLVTSALLLSATQVVKQCSEWCSKLCVEKKIEDSSSVKNIVHLHLSMAIITSSHSEELFQDISTDIRIKIGSIDSSDESQQTSSFLIISRENAQLLVPIIVKNLEKILNDTEWLVLHLKGLLMSLRSSEDRKENDNEKNEAFHEKRRKCEGSICSRICAVASGLIELALTAATTAACIDNLLRGFTSFFVFLTSLSKYYIWLYSQTMGQVPSKFEKLNHFIGSELMRPIYGFIMHAENVQTERLDAPKTQKIRGKKAPKEVVKSISNAGKAKVLRETKNIASLIYAIEQHEHNLILLGRRSKIDFMKSHHLPTSRDFRIRSDVLRMNLRDQDASKEVQQSVNESDGNESDEENEQPHKRLRSHT